MSCCSTMQSGSMLLLLFVQLLLGAPSGCSGFRPPLFHAPSRPGSSVGRASRTRNSRASQQPLAVAVPLESLSYLEPVQSTKPINEQQQGQQPKIGVLLLNLGGPETGDDVEGFLYNLFADPDIIRLPGPLSPLQNVIAWLISKRRAPKSRAAYESIGGGSPILKYSNAQADLLCQSIREKYGLSVKAYIGMRYWHPFTEDALAEIRKDQIEALVIVPLYPQFSISTSGSSLRILQEEFSKNADDYQNLFHTVVPSWYNRPGYVSTMVKLIQKELDSFTADQIAMALQETPSEKPLHVLFSAHGVPQSYIEAGDPYQEQIGACVEMIAKALPHYRKNKDNVEVHLSYQSRVGPVEWLRPYTDDVLPELGKRGVRNLVVVPISFVSEHIETLEEIDIEYRELAEESGVKNWRRCPALNTDPAFIADMADMVMEALSEPAQSVTEACVANSVGDVELEPMDVRLGINTAGIQGVGADGALYYPAAAIAGSSSSSMGDTRRQRQQQEEQVLADKERLNARVAMFGLLITLLVELIRGDSLVHMFGL